MCYGPLKYFVPIQPCAPSLTSWSGQFQEEFFFKEWGWERSTIPDLPVASLACYTMSPTKNIWLRGPCIRWLQTSNYKFQWFFKFYTSHSKGVRLLDGTQAVLFSQFHLNLTHPHVHHEPKGKNKYSFSQSSINTCISLHSKAQYIIESKLITVKINQIYYCITEPEQE